MDSPQRVGSSSAGASPVQPSSKAAAAAPRLNSDVELGRLTSAMATATDIMQLARLGDVTGMERLFESGEFDATFVDDEGITPLHWAAINNQYAMCSFLIQHGADINRKGGDSVATPLQWAAQRCHYYTVNLLLQHGADPLITDAQGYNTLHISTFNGNVLLIVLLLHQGIPVDVLDSYGHTALMWAAYKGFPQCVDVFLRWGASVHASDEHGFTALHWALVKGNPGCVLKLIEYGADRFAKTDTGKTPAVTASELNTQPVWHRALRECGYGHDGHAATPPWPGAGYFLKDKRAFATRFFFLWPFLLTWAVLLILSRLPVFVAVPATAAVVYGVLWSAREVMEYAPPDMRHFHKTPWMSGIFAGSLFLVGLDWLFIVLPATARSIEGSSGHVMLNLVFAVLYCLTTFFFVASGRYDPGYVPKLKGIAEQRAAIDELLKEWKYDESSFCVTCMIRTPLRSKHCRRCQRCVAKHDHHCPWVYNCVGVNNHRHFILYLISLACGILVYDWVLYYYFDGISRDASQSCRLLSVNLCKMLNADGYTLLLSTWISVQLVWVSMLIFTQFFQLSRGTTTYENMTGIHLGPPGTTTALTSTGAPLDPSMDDGVNTTTTPGTTTSNPNGNGSTTTINGNATASRPRGPGGLVKQWSRLLGVDPFIETVAGRGAARGSSNRRRRKNPYSRGCISNCRDFWCDPAPCFGRRDNGAAVLGGAKVDYTAMYESPPLMRLTGMRTRGGGYEAIGTDEV